MDCVKVSTRIAAFLDGELAPGEMEQFSIHIERCEPCARLVIQLESQRFMPLSVQEKSSICSTAEFWGKMDAALGSEMDGMMVDGVLVVEPWYSRRVGLPAPMLLAYAAAMLLAVAWGMQQRERAVTAEVSAEHLGKQLEQERQIAAQPVPNQGNTGSGQFKVVTYTPQSGTF